MYKFLASLNNQRALAKRTSQKMKNGQGTSIIIEMGSGTRCSSCYLEY